MPDTYSIRRSRFPPPPPAEILAGPVHTDASGSMVEEVVLAQAGQLPEYPRIQDIEGMLAPEHLALLS